MTWYPRFSVDSAALGKYIWYFPFSATYGKACNTIFLILFFYLLKLFWNHSEIIVKKTANTLKWICRTSLTTNQSEIKTIFPIFFSIFIKKKYQIQDYHTLGKYYITSKAIENNHSDHHSTQGYHPLFMKSLLRHIRKCQFILLSSMV